MQKAPVLKGSGLAPIDDEPVHVFGRNLEARVVEAREEDDKNEVGKKEHEEDDVETIKKRKFDTITGEENEETVFQGEFKLFVWDVASSNWIEKGRGQLKLNDDFDEQRSRLIMRISGTFRIILNVAIRHSLFKVISSTKTSIRFSDSQNVWAASGSNAKQLGDLLNDRIAAAAEGAQESCEITTKESKTEDNKASTTEAKEEKEDERQDDEKNKDSAGDHSTRNDNTAAVETDENVDRKKQSEEKDDADEGKGNGGDEGDEKDSADDEPEGSQNSNDKSCDHEPEREVAANTNTSDEEDDGRHHKSSDETKRLKLSSD